MSNPETGKSRPDAAAGQTAEHNLHLGELYPIQPLSDEFTLLALAVGARCTEPEDKPAPRSDGRSLLGFRKILRRRSG